MGAVFYVGDAIEIMGKLPAASVDLVLTSPPFLALRSYLPADHPDKHLEGGSQATPGAYIDWLIDVIEACDRVLAPHGSLCFELGDVYSGSGGAGGDYLNAGLRDGQPLFDGSAARGRAQDREYDGGASDRWDFAKPGTKSRVAAGRNWPLAKSLSLIPELFRLTLVYGQNPLTGRQTERWRLRNVIRWVRPNPPVGALGDKFRPATSELMVFCKSARRFFDLDAVREPHKDGRTSSGGGSAISAGVPRGVRGDLQSNPSGAPPLDWWNIPPGGYEGAHYAVWPPELLIKPIKAMCPSRVCTICGLALSLGGGKSLQGMRGVGRQPVGDDVLLADVSQPVHGSEPSEYKGLRSDQGLRVTSPVGPSDGVEGGVRHGASSGNGNGFGAQPRSLGSRASQEWSEGRQQVGEPGTVDEDRTRSVTEADSETAPLSSLRWVDPDISECPACGGALRLGRVLDPFVGSGTTLAVATGHGRDAIGIDLDARNYELALERVGPFLLELGKV